MSEQSSPEQRTAPDRQDSDHYWANKRESRGSLTSIAERDIIRGHAPYNKQSSISDERYWDDYFFNKRDSRGSSRSGIDREMFTEHANTTSQRSSVDEERRRRQVTPKALHLSWTKIVSDLPDIRINWGAELTYLQYSISGALRIALLHPAAV